MEVVQGRRLAVTQVQAVSAGHRAPCNTPEIRVLARAAKIAIDVAVARWESGKAEGIGAVFIRIPSVCCFEHFSCR